MEEEGGAGGGVLRRGIPSGRTGEGGRGWARKGVPPREPPAAAAVDFRPQGPTLLPRGHSFLCEIWEELV